MTGPLDDVGLLTPQASAADANALLDAASAGLRCLGGASVGGWTLAWTITVPLALTAALYGIGLVRLWRRSGIGRGTKPWQVAAFALGWLIMVVALLSPLHDASRRIFTAHMIEHELVIALAAPLFVLARPLPILLWAFPSTLRIRVGRLVHQTAMSLGWRGLTQPLLATILHGLAIWLWHVPVLFQMALRIEWVHWLQHASFLFTALIFWWSLAGHRPERSGTAIVHLFATSLHTGLLGVLLVVSPRLWFPLQTGGASNWGLTSLEDQQLAGLIMWVPAGLIYAGAALLVAALWIARSSGGRRDHVDAVHAL